MDLLPRAGVLPPERTPTSWPDERVWTSCPDERAPTPLLTTPTRDPDQGGSGARRYTPGALFTARGRPRTRALAPTAYALARQLPEGSTPNHVRRIPRPLLPRHRH